MTDDERFDLVRVKALPITPDGLREFATIMRESCGYDSDNMFHLGYQWHDKAHRHVSDMQDKILKAADRIEALEAALDIIAANNSLSLRWMSTAPMPMERWKDNCYEMMHIARAALAGENKDD
jgi:hypothetical protein